MNPEITVTAPVVALAAQSDRDSAESCTFSKHASASEVIGYYLSRADRFEAMVHYLQEEPGVISLNFNDSSDLYWPLVIASQRWEVIGQ